MAQTIVEVVIGKRRLIVNAVTAHAIREKKGLKMKPATLQETQFAGWKTSFKLPKETMEENLAKLTYIS